MRIIMRNILLLIILFLFAGMSPAYAKNETFDIFTYKAPAGYEKDTSKDGMVIYTKTKGNKFCMIGIYQSRQSSGNSQQDFDNEWNELVAKPFGIGDGSVITEDKDSGWDIMLKADKAQTEGTGEFYVTLTSFSGHGRISSVIVNYNDESAFEKDIDSFFNNFDTVKEFDKKQPVASNNTAHVSAGSHPGLKGGKISGVWMGFTVGAFEYNVITKKYGYNSYKVAKEWRVFYDDGTYFSGLPAGGLYNLDIEQSKQDELNNSTQSQQTSAHPMNGRWGKYSISGDIITMNFDVSGNDWRVTLLKPTQIQERTPTFNNIFYKCDSVDGLKLDGTWSSAYNLPIDQESIRFSKNGQFIDYGAFVSSIDKSNPDNAPGSGAYQLKDYSLILNYSDGRVIQKSFVIMGHGPSDKAGMYIERVMFHKVAQ